MNMTEAELTISTTIPQGLIGRVVADDALIAQALSIDDTVMQEVKQAIKAKAEYFLGLSCDCEWESFITGADGDLFWMRPCLTEDNYDCYKDEDCGGVLMDTYQLGFVSSVIGLYVYGKKMGNDSILKQAFLLREYANQVVNNLLNDYISEHPDYMEDMHEEPESVTLALSFAMDLDEWFYGYQNE